MKKNPSVVSVFCGFGLAILGMVMLALGGVLTNITAQNELRMHFVERVNAANQVVTDLSDLDDTFNEYRRTWAEEEKLVYQAYCDQLNQDLTDYSALCAEVSSTQNYIRRIRNFNEYQQELVNTVSENPEQLYAISGYISTAIKLHQQQAREMAQTDLSVSSAEFEDAYSALRGRILVILAVLAILALALLTLMLKTYWSTVRILADVDRHFQELSQARWDVPDLAESGWREFAMLSGMINTLKHRIKEYIGQIEAKAQLEKQLHEERLLNEQQHSMLVTAQMSALRALVNPHFLFNALNLIGVTALVESSESVMQMVESVGNILRYSLYSNGIMTLLDDEVEIVRQYLSLQKRRFGDMLTTEVRNELEGEDYTIPSMTIQPLVENCFKHAFGNKKQLHIRVFIALDEDDIQISVTDNGVGFDPKHKTGGIGLNNIRRRLALQYGEERARMEIESEPDKFSTVTLYIPVDKEKV